MLALDSRWPPASDFDWSRILPVFRRLYHRVIGHFHIERRGFHHWKQWLSKSPREISHFEEFFAKAAAYCDAVVLTSQSLIENDCHLPARASTESLVDKLMRRFGQVLLDEKILAEISPIETNSAKQPRIFALGSAGASATAPRVTMADLLRQRELVFSSFGKPVLHPFLIATRADERCAESVRNQIEGSNILFLATQASARCNGDPWFEFVTLWPFDYNFGPWPD